MRRRSFIAAIGAISLIELVPRMPQAEEGTLDFAVFRKGDRIGHHRMRFNREGDEITVDIDIELGVTFAYIPVYSYEHHNNERWTGGRLAGFESRTDDDGDLFEVRASREGDELVVVGADGEKRLPGDLVPTTYWHRSFLDTDRWINTQNGEVVDASVRSMGSEDVVDMQGRSFAAERFRVEGDLTLDLWYAGDNWVKLTFEASDGSIIEYRLEKSVPIEAPFG